MSSDPRIDLIEITGYQDVATDSASRRIVSALSMASVASESLGNGDGANKLFSVANKEVEIDTLKIYKGSISDANLVGGWAFKKGSGTGGVDEVYVFDTENGTSYIAVYNYKNGGVEANQSVNTSRNEEPQFSVVTGTPAASASVPGNVPARSSSENVAVAAILVPGNWTSGATGVEVYYQEVREPLVHWDEDSDDDVSASPSLLGGRIISAMRFMDKIHQGFRLALRSSSEVVISPGWGVYRGVSFYLPTEKVFAVSAASG